MILIIGAMQEEVQALTSLMSGVTSSNVAGIDVYMGVLSRQEVVVAQSGVGKVNAAYTASCLIGIYNPHLVLNIGSAGGLKADQKHGDMVVATHLQYHDLDIGPGTDTDPRFIFKTDSNLFQIAKQTLESMGKRFHVGLIVSGDQFVTKSSQAFLNIQKHFSDAICVEMEATAIAHVCYRSQTPFIVLRGLSDVTHDPENDLDFEQYLPLASKVSAMLCQQFILNL
ncbi:MULTISPECIES: 5'-methylthioadenosine/adenosylhomocysteine nucleosidase [Erysipelothrix]|uniref:5'-methylthioadenosine/adenosylhomocysteine nucleosidase n=1 Tax=Erysipelothrix TaxID=1647 RepID=UPI001377D0DD|nr:MULTISPECIES: 5'-methylthioadenosine/adenosylhomocysteine nucleosidase [unclassified Erysipelothrix]MBK2402395.1 5'-methylthioadenosine/adenosylhomocysteine nucleosidase [Erysipelothrix sp. strain 2 (EsS2-6-Brazil)]MBK2403432.1 5'-methylthioadenosine/adenosylhomocysteine nucleosidase [Erysipelothrix sp. strain 2 (EsS2-7-Brazil)]NBA00600.1 5'-methylthioadenosine/adenosylhomocysteine nucleosidase [Erysipelothrix rhusiopathiae]